MKHTTMTHSHHFIHRDQRSYDDPMLEAEHALAAVLYSFGIECNTALYMALGYKDCRTVAEKENAL